MARRPRRREARSLAEMTDQELAEVVYFGSLVADPHTVTFSATPEEQAEARRILAEREAGRC